MIKDIAEDLILIGLVILALFLAWKYWLKDALAGVFQGAKETAAAYKEDTKTIAAAASSPWETVKDLFRSTTPYISQADQAAAIEKIKRNLAGKM